MKMVMEEAIEHVKILFICGLASKAKLPKKVVE